MPPTEPTLRQLIDAAAQVLDQAGVPSPHADAVALAEHLLPVDRLVLAMAPELPESFTGHFAQLVERRRQRVPQQHLTGVAHFRFLQMHAAPGVFIPRPETEVVAQEAIDPAKELVAQGGSPVVVDLCCGAGPIAVSVAHEVPGARVYAMDINPDAVQLTARNAKKHGAHVQVSVGDVSDPELFDHLDGAVDVLVANPPYIPPDAVPNEPEVAVYDPDVALYGGGTDGLDLPKAVVVAAGRLLKPGGVFVMEHAEVQDAAVRDVVSATDLFTEIRSTKDLTGRWRMVVARRRSDAD